MRERERERERERREDTPVLSRMIDRSGGMVVYFMQQGLTRRARRHERDASTPTYPGRFRSSVERERDYIYADYDTFAYKISSRNMRTNERTK